MAKVQSPIPADEKLPATRRIAALAKKLKLAEVELSTHYGDPSLKVQGKAFATVKEAGILVLHCPLDMKELLLEMAPDVYYQTDHFKGWPGLLIRLEIIGDEELGLRLEDAWRFKAPKALAAARPTAGN
jgi:hypothetical protein